MNGPKLLIDTNILFGLEDHKQTSPNFSAFQQKCQQYGVQIYIHEATKQDVDRDKDENRQQIILSKIEKFLILDGIPVPDRDDLESLYGTISGDNDYVDTILLYALHEIGAVDFLITQDRGIHKRARNIGIPDRVFRIEDALVWLRDTYERIEVSLPYIEEKQCHQINRHDSIFCSLREDYTQFEQWFHESCVKKHRDCWTVNFNDEIAGIAIRKDESFSDLKNDIASSEKFFLSSPNKILKICTFKIKDEYRGEKLGEQLIKQILWWASKNAYDFVYLTVYPKHRYLIDMLVLYGFESIGRTKGELYLGKSFSANVLNTIAKDEPLAYHRQYYPKFLSDTRVKKYLISIKGEYYKTLFPENISDRQKGLFDSSDVNEFNKIPGNTIRKVYVCRSNIKSIKQGDILLFFHCKDSNSLHSQSLITVGIVDGFDMTSSHEEILRLTAKRSAFSQSELIDLTENDTKNVKVINFLLAGHISPAILYDQMTGVGMKGPYQSIRGVSDDHFSQLQVEDSLDVKTT